MEKHTIFATLISFCIGLTLAAPTIFAQSSVQTNTPARESSQRPVSYDNVSQKSNIPSTTIDSTNPSKQAMLDQIEAIMNHNEGNVLSKDNDLAKNWTQRITVSGQLNVDGKWRTTHGPTGSLIYPRDHSISSPSLFQIGHYDDIYLNNSQLDIDAKINQWTQAHISLTGQDPTAVNHVYRTDIYDDAPINLDEAYITIGNFNKSPLYTTLGRQYIPFGVYDRHPIEPTLTQYLAQTQTTAAKLGFALPNGTYGSVYIFRGQSFQTEDERFSHFSFHVNNFGGELGIKNASDIRNMPLNYELSVGYLEDLGDTDWIADVAGGGINGVSTGTHDVPGISVDGKIGTGDFVWHGSYVQALSHFETDVVADTLYIGEDTFLRELNNAKPWAFVFSGDYNFSVMGHDSTFSLNYQQSGDLQTLGIPRTRYGGSYTVALLRDTHLTFDIFEDYNSEDTIADLTRRTATQADLRLSVDF